MSMGYDDDDPRREAMLSGLRSGYWKLQPGQAPNVDASKFRAGRDTRKFAAKGEP